MDPVDVPIGTGSGFIWDNLGHIVTNYHVIRNAETAKVVVSDGGMQRTFNASLVGYNPDKDVAVLGIDPAEARRFRPLDIGTSSSLRVGQTTLAIGNPFGLDHSLTIGIVSGLGREVRSPSGRPITNVIQTDAAINPGNSGGALLDSSGRLIGMNTAILSPSGASSGIGFAVPVDTLKYQVKTILEKGKVTRAIIGISYMAAPQARALGVDKGVLVMNVPEGSPPALAGLRGSARTASGEALLGDVIVAVEGAPIVTDLDLFRALDPLRPGQRIRVTVLRREADGNGADKRLDLNITLQAADAT